MKKLILASLFLCGINFAHASDFKTLKDEQATLQLCQKSAEVFNQTLDLKRSVDVLRPYFILPEKLDISNNFEAKQMIEMGQPLWGNMVATVFIDSKKYANDNFIRHRFLLKRTNYALSYQCTFYKPVNEWQLSDYSWSDTPAIFNE